MNLYFRKILIHDQLRDDLVVILQMSFVLDPGKPEGSLVINLVDWSVSGQAVVRPSVNTLETAHQFFFEILPWINNVKSVTQQEFSKFSVKIGFGANFSMSFGPIFWDRLSKVSHFGPRFMGRSYVITLVHPLVCLSVFKYLRDCLLDSSNFLHKVRAP